MLYEDRELLYVFQFVTTSLGILDLTTNVGIAIAVKDLTTRLLLAKYFDVSLRKSKASY